jgi:hypothetical protein
MKTIAWLAGIATLVMSGVYTIVSLARWEWNRALFFGLMVLIAEVGLGIALVLRRLAQVLASQTDTDDVLPVLISTRRPPEDRFAWLKESMFGRTNVFIVFLVGGGVLVSGLAWIVDKLAATTATPLGEARLASQLGAISYPRGGLVVDDITVLAQDTPGSDDAQIRKLLRRASQA